MDYFGNQLRQLSQGIPSQDNVLEIINKENIKRETEKGRLESFTQNICHNLCKE